MESARLLRYIDNSDLLSDPNALVELEAAVNKFPFFPIFQMLYLKSLRLQSKFNYNLQLRITAMHAKDRTRLFYYINSDIYAPSLEEDAAKERVSPQSVEPKQVRINPEPLIDDPSKSDENNLNSAQLERFISRSDAYKKISPSSSTSKGEDGDRLEIDKSLYTETLANLFLEQKKYEQALEAYEYLILKKPEKKELFEEKITAIKKLL